MHKVGAVKWMGAALFQPQLLGDAVGSFLKSKPGEEILEVAGDGEGGSDGRFPFLTQLFDLVVMAVVEGVGLRVPDQRCDPAANTAMAGQVIEESRDILVLERFAGNLGGDVVLSKHLGQSISDIRICGYTERVHG